MQKRQLALATTFSGLLLVLAVLALSNPPLRPLGLSTHRSEFGSTGLGRIGWRLPANTIVSTSHTANQSLSGFIAAKMNVFSYQIKPGTVLYLSLYVNGQFSATQKYELTGVYDNPATVVGSVGMEVANFSGSTLGFTVSQLSLGSPLPAGTIVTVTTWASDPIWVQVDNTSQTRSYATPNVSSFSAPSVITANAGDLTPHTVSVELESSEQ